MAAQEKRMKRRALVYAGIVLLLAFVTWAALLGARLLDYGGQLYKPVLAGDRIAVRIMIAAGANIEWVLHTAVQVGDEGMVRLLLAAGGDPNAADHNGHSPMSWAILQNREGIKTILEEAGAKPTRVDMVFAEDLDALRAELEADPKALALSYGTFGFSLLHHAALRGKIESAKLLVELGADTHMKDVVGRTPLNVAKDADQRDLVEYLGDLE